MLYEVITLAVLGYLEAVEHRGQARQQDVQAEHAGEGARITSYNVCYTKLLRFDAYRYELRTEMFVITSYSIHYTKLYDHFYKNYKLHTQH